MEKLFYSIGEVADILGESVSLVRFWTNSFPRLIKPDRNTKGNRRYSAKDIEVLKNVHYLVKTKGLTLDGAARQLSSASQTDVDRSVKALESLRSIKEQLLEIKKEL